MLNKDGLYNKLLNITDWKTTGEPGGLPSMGLHRVGHDLNNLAAAVANSL